MTAGDEWVSHWRSGAGEPNPASALWAVAVDDLQTELARLGVRTAGPGVDVHSLENRVFEFSRPGRPALVAKLYRPGSWSRAALDEEHQFLLELRDAKVPVSAPIRLPSGSTVGEWRNIHFALFDGIDVQDRSNSELDDAEIERLGRLAALLHNVGARRQARMRRSMSPMAQLVGGCRFLHCCGHMPAEISAELDSQVRATAAALERTIGDAQAIRVHGDFGLWSVHWSPNGPVLFDFDDMGNGPAVQDLALLALGIGGFANADACSARRVRILQLLDRGYRARRPIDPDWQAAVGPVLAARRVHVSAWIASRWQEPSFRRKYPNFHSPSRWRLEFERMERARG